MAKGGGGKGEATFTWDDPAVLLGIAVALWLACWAMWYFGHKYISMAYTYVRYIELWAFNALGSMADIPVVSRAHRWIQKTCQPDGLLSLCNRDFETMKWSEIANSTFIGNAVCLALLVILCFRLFIKANKIHPKLNFIKTHNIASFVREQKAQYPHLRLFSELDLIEQPLDHAVFGMSETSRQFAYKHRLIAGWKQQADGTWIPSLDRDKAALVFRSQLGKHWTKSTELTVAETLLVAIAMPRVAATDANLSESEFKAAMADSERMILYCWDAFTPPAKKGKGKGDDYAWLKPQIDVAPAREVILKYIGHGNVRAVLDRHAFVKTVLAALFMQARRLGVLQPAEMRWLRFFDRELWYALQNIGRQSGFAEGAALLSHYLYEAKAGTALAEPQLDKAVTALDESLCSYKYVTADKERYEKLGEAEDKKPEKP